MNRSSHENLVYVLYDLQFSIVVREVDLVDFGMKTLDSIRKKEQINRNQNQMKTIDIEGLVVETTKLLFLFKCK